MKYNKMLISFENEIDNEAHRIIDILVNKAEKKEIVNMNFDELIEILINKKYDFYKLIIKSRVLNNIPDYYGIDIDGVYSLIPRQLSLEKKIRNYINDIKESNGNDYKKVAYKLAEYLIDNNILEFELASTINKFKRIYYITYFDSYAYAATSFFLEDALRKKGYIVESYTPRIKIRKES